MDVIAIINDGITIKTAAAMVGKVADHCREVGTPVSKQMIYNLIRAGNIEKLARGIVSRGSVQQYVNTREMIKELKNDSIT